MSPRADGWQATVATLMCGMIALSIAGLASAFLAQLAGVLSFVAAAILLPRVPKAQLLIVVAITAIGLGLVVAGSIQGADPEWSRMLTLNQGLISMLAAVTFLQLIAGGLADVRPVLRGRAAVVRTMAMVHALGSVINVSALILVGNRLARGRQLSWPESVLLSRSYACVAFWSPFWGATAVALTYAPDASLTVIIPLGLVLAVVVLALSVHAVCRQLGDRTADFTGYPASMRLLWIPLVLIAGCLAAHVLQPHAPMTGVVAVAALALTVLVLVIRDPRASARRLAAHARARLPAMGGELTLFCSAGVLAIGISTVVQVATPPVPIDRLTGWSAWGLLLLIVAVSMLGVHPAISIASAAALLYPVSPDPTLFALTSVLAWGAVAAAGPLSGLNVVMRGLFGVDNVRLARRNWGYLAEVLVLALPLLHLCERLT